MANKWTKNQINAIYSTGGTVLVSAAAGSGKTSVLVQRVIERITDEKNPIDLDKFLIVTFTNAAAQEMKDRILKSLSDLILKNPKDLNLHKQQMLIKSASIGTIHSFCNNLVKENFYKLGISPNFRISTESELVSLKEKALENTFDYFYSFENEKFTEVLNVFSGEKSREKIEDIIQKISYFMDSLPFPEKWFEDISKLYENDLSFEKNIWVKSVLESLKDSLNFAASLLKDSVEIINEFEDLKKVYLNTFEKDLNNIEELIKSFDSFSWEKIREKFNKFSFSRLKPFRTENLEECKNKIVTKRDYAKKIISDMKSKYFIFTEERTKEDLKYIIRLSEMLFKVAFHFRNEVWSLKILKNTLEFSDLERLTIKLLSKDGNSLKKSILAEEISKKYDEIMVDEYQDINDVQNVIFKLITENEENLFMVGDVKQSIYKFRQSRPDIFLSKKEKYNIYDENFPKYPSKIILDKNFRSKKSIIESVNMIFKSLMSKEVGEMEYGEEEKLSYAADYSESEENGVSFKVVSLKDSDESDVIEAREIAKTILKMISEGYKVKQGNTYRNATYSDFCVLLRSSNSHAHIYSRELNLCCVPSFSETNDQFLGTSEISSMVSLLKVIDNPIDDVSIVACMVSPIFSFSIEKLGTLRCENKEKPFYFLLKDYYKKSEDITNFLDKIEMYRRVGGTLSCSELIDYIYQDTEYPYILLASPGGNLKKANLLLLRDYAKKFDDDFSGGLSGFIKFIDGIKKRNCDLPSASVSSEVENTVKVMSIHKSKGLEFPICILAGCQRKFAMDNESIVFHPDLGVAFKSKSNDGLIEYDNLIFKSLNLKNKNEGISEEMRILYVALTRAKQKLVIFSAVKDLKKIKDKCIFMDSFKSVPKYLVKSADCFLDWFIICICFSPLKCKLFESLGIEFSGKNPEIKEEINWEIEIIKNEDKEEISEYKYEGPSFQKDDFSDSDFEEIRKKTSYEYPFKHLFETPIKIAASKLSSSGEWKEYFASSKPKFMSFSNASSAEKGTVMHKFMCFADLKKAYENLDFEVENLVKRGLISFEEFKLLNLDSIKKFVNSDLCQRILKSPKVLREHRFSINMPIKNTPFYSKNDEGSIVVQGAMDCAFIENGKFVIVDYKTDKVEDIHTLYEKYVSQLEIYKYALEETTSIDVKEIGIYSFYLSRYCF